MAPTIELNNGITMPQIDFGVFQVPDLQQAETAVMLLVIKVRQK
jgi:2,5-diketo-D-gluconate reductase A